MVSQQVTGYWVGFKTKKENLCHRKPFKNDEKYFLFHLKNSFRSQDIFALTFWLYRKNDLIRKIRLISNFMTSKPG